MELKLVRDVFTPQSTTGLFYVGGNQFGVTLELPVRDGQPGSAIPEGTYPVISEWSAKFGRAMPRIIHIPNRSLIEIHWGNSPIDTNGCILLGKTRFQKDWIGMSVPTFDAFWPLFMQGLASGGVSIVVSSIQTASNHDSVQAAVTGEL